MALSLFPPWVGVTKRRCGHVSRKSPIVDPTPTWRAPTVKGNATVFRTFSFGSKGRLGPRLQSWNQRTCVFATLSRVLESGSGVKWPVCESAGICAEGANVNLKS
ncbi:hypothetical protein HYQ46_012102 [Verticillium longisporum]|nr:hypothetical protein HYQ46_012102 [Verticillium longisporum]